MNALLLASFFAGCAIATYGVWLIHHPAGYIAAGAAVALSAARVARDQEGT